MLTEVGSNQPPSKKSIASNLSEAIKQAENRCKDCKTSSPMICVERCDVWKVKNEIFSVRRITSEQGHAQHLLNTVKNLRRLKILDALCEQPRGIGDLQRYLRQEGFCHSCSTIKVAYVKPLIGAGLVREDTSSRYRITFYGRRVHHLLHTMRPEVLLPVHSCCYEEIVIKELMKQPKTFDELAESVPKKSLARILMRLRDRGLLLQRSEREYVFYHKIKGKLRIRLSPTEKRIFETIPKEGISTRQLSEVAKITVRRTYKYLRRLREKKLVFALKKPRIYELTGLGKEISALLSEMDKLTDSTAVLILQH